MLFDTDILIWVQKGQKPAAELIEKSEERYLSIQSYMELLQCAQNKSHLKQAKDFISFCEFIILPLTENIGHRASIYIEEYTLSSGLRAGDAVIAATATEHHLTLATSNARHFRPIKDLELKVYKPR